VLFHLQELEYKLTSCWLLGSQCVPQQDFYFKCCLPQGYASRLTNLHPELTRIHVYSDLVQDLYLKELKSYKPVPVAQDAHVGVVKTYSQPTAPKAPSLPTDLASELSAYDATEPTKATVETKKSTGQEQDTGTGADAYLSFLEADEPKAEEAHH